MSHRRPLATAAALLVMSCAADSDSIDTSEFDIEFNVTVHDGPKPSTVLRAYVNAGFKDLELTGGDEIHVVTDKGDDYVLVEDGTGLAGFYELELPGVADRSEFKFELRRTDKPSALATSITITEALALTEPIEGKSFAFADAIEVKWSNPVPDTSMYVTASPCDGSVQLDTSEPTAVADTGTLSIRPSDLIVGEPDAKGTCVDVQIERSGWLEQAIDPALNEDSEVGAHRVVTYRITLTP